MAAATIIIPPTLPECGDYDGAVLLDRRCYIADLHNATTASGATSRGLPIQVTFCDARPPLLSYLCVHCPGLEFRRSSSRVVATDADLVLLRVPTRLNASLRIQSWDYFLYRARAHHLDLLPNPHPICFRDSSAALLSRQDGAWYAVAAITSCPVYEDESDLIIRWDFFLHLYRSSDSAGWITMPMSLEELVSPLPGDLADEVPWHKTSKTLTIGGERGTVAWVDLWRGILFCDVLAEPPVFQDIPLPMPLPARGNWNRLLRQREPNCIRDVVITRRRDTIKYIEMEMCPQRKEAETPDSYFDWVRCKSSFTQDIPGGWKATTWIMPIPVGSFTDWQSDCEVEVKDVTMDTSDPHHLNLLSKLSGSDTAQTLQKLPMAYPTISIDDDIVYFFYSNNPRYVERHTQKLEAVIAIDVRNKTLRAVAEIDVRKSYVIMPVFCTSEICRYLRTDTSVDLKRSEKEAVKPINKEDCKLSTMHVKGTDLEKEGCDST